ncbi:MAG: RsmE family RNA methyltransferase, partial [Thermodesulfobacteriota bacterium]
MRRFFIEHIPGEGCLISITGKEANHIRNVLRMKPGDSLTLMDGKGHLFEAIIKESGRKGVEAKIIKTLQAPPPSPVKIHLAQALIKPRHMDLLIQKATELGVSSITPFLSERTALKVSAEQLARKMDHWNEIMKAACKQSGSSSLPALNPPASFEELIGNGGHEGMLKILLWEAEKEKDLKAVLRTRVQP